MFFPLFRRSSSDVKMVCMDSMTVDFSVYMPRPNAVALQRKK